MILEYVNGILVYKVNYILDIIKKFNLEFDISPFSDDDKFSLEHREYICKTFKGIDESEFNMFKHAYDDDTTFMDEDIYTYHDF